MFREITKIVLWCAALLAVTGWPLLAQDALWERVRATYDPASVESIQAVVKEAERLQVPAEPILEKALEGAAKGVPSGRVLPALHEYAARLGRTARLLPPPHSRAALVAGADALRRGVSGEAVQEMARANPEAAPTTLVVLGDLVEAGVPVGEAREAVREAMRRGVGQPELLDLPAMVRRRIREGMPPGQAARGAAAGIGPGGPPPWAGAPGGASMGAHPGKPPVPPGHEKKKGKSGKGGRGAGGGGR
jgi:hypothetical protein